MAVINNPLACKDLFQSACILELMDDLATEIGHVEKLNPLAPGVTSNRRGGSDNARLDEGGTYGCRFR